jgi:hypothetical protein
MLGKILSATLGASSQSSKISNKFSKRPRGDLLDFSNILISQLEFRKSEFKISIII